MTRVHVAASAVMALLIAAPALAQDGAALYAQRCASCHEGGQVARAPARDVIAALTPDRIVSALETGTMRVQGESLTRGSATRDRRPTFRRRGRRRPARRPVAAPRCAAAERAAAVGERLARVGRDAGQRPLSAPAGILRRRRRRT